MTLAVQLAVVSRDRGLKGWCQRFAQGLHLGEEQEIEALAHTGGRVRGPGWGEVGAPKVAAVACANALKSAGRARTARRDCQYLFRRLIRFLQEIETSLAELYSRDSGPELP